MWGDWGIQASVHLLGERSNLLVDVTAVQETHFTCTENCRVLEGDFVVFLAFSYCYSPGVSQLVGCNLNAIVNLVFAYDGEQLFWVVVVYTPSSIGERCSFFQQLGLFLDDLKWLVLVGDWNAILGPKLDKPGQGARGLDRHESSLINLLAEHNLVNRFLLDDWGQEMWT